MYDYTTVNAVIVSLPSIASVTSISSETIATYFIVPAEALINAKISKLYSVPVAGRPPLLEMIARDLTTHRLLRRFYANERQTKSDSPDRFKESLELLDQIAAGELELTTQSGAAIGQLASGGAVAWSNTSDYIPTFQDDANDIGSVLDPYKVEDIDASRA